MLSPAGLSFVLQRDDILADDTAVAPKLGQVVGLGENTDKLHRALAARAARSVWFVVYIRHGQRAMLVKPQVKKGRSRGQTRPAPSERCFAVPPSYFPDDQDPGLCAGVPKVRRRSAAQWLGF